MATAGDRHSNQVTNSLTPKLVRSISPKLLIYPLSIARVSFLRGGFLKEAHLSLSVAPGPWCVLEGPAPVQPIAPSLVATARSLLCPPTPGQCRACHSSAVGCVPSGQLYALPGPEAQGSSKPAEERVNVQAPVDPGWPGPPPLALTFRGWRSVGGNRLSFGLPFLHTRATS